MLMGTVPVGPAAPPRSRHMKGAGTGVKRRIIRNRYPSIPSGDPRSPTSKTFTPARWRIIRRIHQQVIAGANDDGWSVGVGTGFFDRRQRGCRVPCSSRHQLLLIVCCSPPPVVRPALQSVTRSQGPCDSPVFSPQPHSAARPDPTTQKQKLQ